MSRICLRRCLTAYPWAVPLPMRQHWSHFQLPCTTDPKIGVMKAIALRFAFSHLVNLVYLFSDLVSLP